MVNEEEPWPPTYTPHQAPRLPAGNSGRRDRSACNEERSALNIPSEWVALHRAIGVQFLIYTNDCTDGTTRDTWIEMQALGDQHRNKNG